VTPSLPEILIGHALAISAPQPPEASGDYMAGRLGVLAMLSMLAAQEAERGVEARLWENGAMRALFAGAADAYDEAMAGDLARAAALADVDRAWSALDVANARLRRALIRLHETAEGRADTALERDILALYQAMARARRLELAGA